MTTLIVRASARLLTPIMLVISAYLLVRGHTAPGGGFVAAAVTGLAIVYRWFAFGPASADRLMRLGAGNLIAIGLLLSLITGLGGFVWGHSFLEAAVVRRQLPVLGKLELSSTLLFEVGVFLVVVAVAIAVVQELGGE